MKQSEARPKRPRLTDTQADRVAALLRPYRELMAQARKASA